MSELKHTPGPWNIRVNSSTMDIESQKGQPIATVWALVQSGWDEEQANFALILSAPELLKALMEIIPLAERGRGHYPERAPKEQELIDNALRAIRWATQKIETP